MSLEEVERAGEEEGSGRRGALPGPLAIAGEPPKEGGPPVKACRA